MGKKLRKSLSVLLLALAVAVTQIPPADAGAAKKTDFVIDGTTLISYEGTEASVSVPRTVTKIAQNAFADNLVVKKITLPDTIEEIESGAFAGCGSLTEINLPSSVEKLGSGVFADCWSLEAVEVSNNNRFFSYRDGALYNKQQTKLYQAFAGNKQSVFFIRDSVETIEKYAFWGCENIGQIVLGRMLTEVPEYAFSNCKGLKTITIPSMITAIQLKAFEDCVNLEDIYISPSVTSIHETAFDGCRKINFQYEEGTVAAKFAKEYQVTNVSVADYEESENVATVRPSQNGTNTVSNNQTYNSGADVSKLDMSKLPDSLETAENTDVMGKTKIVSSQAVVFLDNTKMQVYSGTDSQKAQSNLETSEMTENVQPETEIFYDQEEVVEKYIVVNSDTIADRAFYKDNTRTSYEIPDGIKRIGDFSFAYTGLRTIELPYGVKSIGYGAFYQAAALETVVIPKTVDTIEPSAFEGTAWLNNWKTGPDVNDFLVVGDGILISYKGTDSKKVTIPENVKKIVAGVFSGHSEIESVYIPDSVEEVGEEAFMDCISLKNVSGGNYVKKICDRAFLNCPLEQIRIPAFVESIGLRAFDQENGGKSDSVIFLGNTLPKVSYEKTAARYSNKEYRQNALNSVNVAIVNNSISDFENTILDDDAMGFFGIVCTVSREPTETERGRVEVKQVSIGADGYPAAVPEVVWIFGKEYEVDRIDTAAYQKETFVSSNEEGVAEEDTIETEAVNQNLEIKLIHPEYKDNPLTALSFSGSGNGYTVTLSENTETEETLSALLNERYGPVTESNFKSFSLSMTTKKGNIQIEKLGKERLTVTVPVSSEWIDTPIVAVCLDSNGQLEFMSCRQYSSKSGSYVTFEAKHFSPYGLYQGENVPKSFKDAFDDKIAIKKGAEYNVDYGRKDISPDTGDYVELKWIVSVGLLALAGFLFFGKNRKDIVIEKQ